MAFQNGLLDWLVCACAGRGASLELDRRLLLQKFRLLPDIHAPTNGPYISNQATETLLKLSDEDGKMPAPARRYLAQPWNGNLPAEMALNKNNLQLMIDSRLLMPATWSQEHTDLSIAQQQHKNRQRETIKGSSVFTQDADNMLQTSVNNHKAVTTNVNITAIKSNAHMGSAMKDNNMEDRASEPLETESTHGSKEQPKMFGPFLPYSDDQLLSMRLSRNPRAKVEDMSAGPKKKRFLVAIADGDKLPALSATNRVRRT